METRNKIIAIIETINDERVLDYILRMLESIRDRWF